MSRFLKWLDNYWYHYKWVTIVVAFLLIVGIVLTVQMIQKVEYDAYVMYLGEDEIPNTQYQDILSSLSKVVSDENGDKEVLINFARTPYIADQDDPRATSVNANAMKFMSTMIVQPYYIYLINKDVYELYKGKDLFVPLCDLLPNAADELFYDDYAVYFSQTEFARKNAGVDHLDDNTLLVVKNVPYSPSKATVEAEKVAFQAHVQVVKNIISFKEGQK